MGSVENIQTNVQTAIGKVPGEPIAQAITACETAGNILAEVSSVEDVMADAAVSVQMAVHGLRKASNALETGSTSLGEYLSDIGASAPETPSVQSEPAQLRIGRHILFLPDADVNTEVNDPNAPKTFTPDQHRQKEPEAWHGLLEICGNLVADGVSPEQAATVMYKVFGRLGDQQIEDVRYYALGEHSAQLAPYLRDPEVRQQIIAAAAQAVVENHPNYIKNTASGSLNQGMHVREISSQQLKHGVTTTVEDAFGRLPPEVQQLGDVINAYSILRAHIRQHEQLLPVEPLLIDSLARKGGIVTALGNNVFSAVSVLMQETLFLMAAPKLGEQRKGVFGADSTNSLLIRDVIDPEELRTLDFMQAAQAGARVHVDEFTYGTYTREHLSLRDGKPHLDVKNLPKQAARIPVHTPSVLGTRALHDKRIGCPARFVMPLIPSVLEITPEILIAADKQIRGGR